jgi:nicotinamide riboside kinase
MGTQVVGTFGALRQCDAHTVTNAIGPSSLSSRAEMNDTGATVVIVRSADGVSGPPFEARCSWIQELWPNVAWQTCETVNDAFVTSDRSPLLRSIVVPSPNDVLLNPTEYFGEFVVPVRRALTSRICFVGAESTGKSTLVKALAEKYDTMFMNEYGRDYTVAKKQNGTNDHWTSEDFVVIAQQQQLREDLAAEKAGPLLFCDTDAMSTDLWHERYLGTRLHAVNVIARRRRYDLFVLCDIDVPWEADGIRLGAQTRFVMHKRFVDVLTNERPEPWVMVSGDLETRIHQVETAISEHRLLQPDRMYAWDRWTDVEGNPIKR